MLSVLLRGRIDLRDLNNLHRPSLNVSAFWLTSKIYLGRFLCDQNFILNLWRLSMKGHDQVKIVSKSKNDVSKMPCI